MNDCMTQGDAMNMNNEQAVSILIPLRDMMRDQYGCPISDAYFALDKAIEALKQLTQPNTPNTLNALDTISRQAAIEAIKKSRFLVDAMEKVIKLPSVQPDPEWIPCRERLPIGSDIVLLSLPPSIDMNGDELVGGVICGHYISGKNENWGISDGSTFGYGLVSARYGTNPTHWMPLPEPYQEGKNE